MDELPSFDLCGQVALVTGAARGLGRAMALALAGAGADVAPGGGVGRHGITVNAVAPTFIATQGTEPALADPAFRADTIERIAALHRIGRPVEVSAAVLFLASPAASLITGHTLAIDGGWTAR